MLVWLLKVTVLAYLGLGLYLYVAQRSFMYFPVAGREASDVRAEYLANGDASIKLWVLGPDSERAVIYFGGNAEDVYYNAGDFRAALPEFATFLVNYRGYGGSSGSPTEANLFSDALRIYDEVRARHAQVTVIGRSLGSGVAAYLASQRDVHRLILVTPLDSALALAKAMYPVYPVSLLLKDRYQSVAYAPEIEAPTLFVMAEHDRIVPREHSIRLADAFRPGLVEQVVIPNAGHNGLSGHPRYWQAFERFLNP